MKATKRHFLSTCQSLNLNRRGEEGRGGEREGEGGREGEWEEEGEGEGEG